jgi:hypothetical protein
MLQQAALLVACRLAARSLLMAILDENGGKKDLAKEVGKNGGNKDLAMKD